MKWNYFCGGITTGRNLAEESKPVSITVESRMKSSKTSLWIPSCGVSLQVQQQTDAYRVRDSSGSPKNGILRPHWSEALRCVQRVTGLQCAIIVVRQMMISGILKKHSHAPESLISNCIRDQ
jgi:hypothetical protein